MRRALTGVAALALAGCIGVQQAPPVVSYSAAAIAPKADADGWYTFGQTRFKGNLLDGAPDGAGQCTDPYRRTPVPCNFSKGVRVDAAYLAEKKEEIADKRRREEQERREQAAWEAKQAREMAQARKEANAWLAGEIAKTPARMSEQMARVDAASRGTSVEEEAAKKRRQIEFDARIAEQAADPNSELNQAKRRDEQRAQARREADDRAEKLRRQQEADRKNARVAQAQKSAAEAAEEKRHEDQRQAKERAEAEKKEADEKARKQAQERERARLEAERVAREEARKREQERLAAAAAEKAAKEAKAQAERQAKADYLRELASRTRLLARTCFGPKYYIVGVRPKITPKAVDCVDLRYRARCEGSNASNDGVLKNFLGASTDCYMGDAAEMSPTPACPVAQVRIEVLSASGCGD